MEQFRFGGRTSVAHSDPRGPSLACAGRQVAERKAPTATDTVVPGDDGGVPRTRPREPLPQYGRPRARGIE